MDGSWRKTNLRLLVPVLTNPCPFPCLRYVVKWGRCRLDLARQCSTAPQSVERQVRPAEAQRAVPKLAVRQILACSARCGPVRRCNLMFSALMSLLQLRPLSTRSHKCRRLYRGIPSKAAIGLLADLEALLRLLLHALLFHTATLTFDSTKLSSVLT